MHMKVTEWMNLLHVIYIKQPHENFKPCKGVGSPYEPPCDLVLHCEGAPLEFSSGGAATGSVYEPRTRRSQTHINKVVSPLFHKSPVQEQLQQMIDKVLRASRLNIHNTKSLSLIRLVSWSMGETTAA